MMSPCACIGPAGDCPCIRTEKGLPVKITETYIAPEVYDCLPDEDKRTINVLKMKAVALYIRKKKDVK